jgi:ankyrin repeat protein
VAGDTGVRPVGTASYPRRARATFDRIGRPYDVDRTRRTPVTATNDLISAVTAGDADRVSALLAADPTLAGARDAAGVSALMLARYRSDRAVTDALLAADPELDVFEAAALGRIDRLRPLLDEFPASSAALSPDGFTALHLAAFFGKEEAARLLIERGAPVGRLSENDLTVEPLHSAAAGRHHGICRLLIAAGADPNAPQQGGWRPLHQAAQHGDPELLELFLSAGADPRLGRDDGELPAETADAAGHPDVAARLRSGAAPR